MLLSKNQQAVRQLKFMSGAVNGAWRIDDADAGAAVSGFITKTGIWDTRRSLARWLLDRQVGCGCRSDGRARATDLVGEQDEHQCGCGRKRLEQ